MLSLTDQNHFFLNAFLRKYIKTCKNEAKQNAVPELKLKFALTPLTIAHEQSSVISPLQTITSTSPYDVCLMVCMVEWVT